MAKRMIHHNTCTSEKFGEVSFEAETTYFRLLVFTDDYGNTRSGAGYVKDLCFPDSDTNSNHRNNKISYDNVKTWLKELINTGLIIEYVVDGIKYYHFDKFDEFQDLRKDRLKDSSIPKFEKSSKLADSALRTSYESTLLNPAAEVESTKTTPCKKPPHELEEEVEVEVEQKEEREDKPKDVFVCPEIDKIFKIYEDNCSGLLKLGFERRNLTIRQLVLAFLEETGDDFNYFREVCQKANTLKEIAGNKIDFKMVLNNHIGIMNGKYEKDQGFNPLEAFKDE